MLKFHPFITLYILLFHTDTDYKTNGRNSISKREHVNKTVYYNMTTKSAKYRYKETEFINFCIMVSRRVKLYME
jgi:hypothetical protein